MRDLLIDHLMRHANERRRFLERCSLDGFLLAISAAGGATGERTFPLLETDSDWARLTDRAGNIVSQVGDTELRVLLAALREAFGSLRESRSRDQLRPFLNELVDACLRLVRDRWNTASVPIDRRDLAEYVAVSIYLERLPPMPDLRASWSAVVPETAEEAAEMPWEGPGSLIAWGELASLIANSEPRFLRKVSFRRYGDHLDAVLAAVEEVTHDMGRIDNPDPFSDQLDPSDPWDHDYSDNEADQAAELEDMGRVLQVFQALWLNDEQRRRAATLHNLVEQQQQIRVDRAESVRDRTGPDEDRDDAHRGPASRAFDIDKVFSDL